MKEIVVVRKEIVVVVIETLAVGSKMWWQNRGNQRKRMTIAERSGAKTMRQQWQMCKMKEVVVK